MKREMLPALLLATLMAGPLLAQAPGAGRGRGRVSFVLSGGARLPSGWVDQIERGMVAGNLDGDVCGDAGEVFCSAAPRPSSDEDLPTYSVEVAFRPVAAYEIAFQIGVAHPGSVDGYFDGGTTGLGLSDAELRLEPQTVTLATSVRYIGPGGVRIGGGPALHLSRISAVTIFQERDETRVLPGFVLDASAGIPLHSTFFVQLGVRYRWMKPATYGPYDAVNMNGDVLAVFPATSAAFNTLLAEIGLGLRL